MKYVFLVITFLYLIGCVSPQKVVMPLSEEDFKKVVKSQNVTSMKTYPQNWCNIYVRYTYEEYAQFKTNSSCSKILKGI